MSKKKIYSFKNSILLFLKIYENFQFEYSIPTVSFNILIKNLFHKYNNETYEIRTTDFITEHGSLSCYDIPVWKNKNFIKKEIFYYNISKNATDEQKKMSSILKKYGIKIIENNNYIFLYSDNVAKIKSYIADDNKLSRKIKRNTNEKIKNEYKKLEKYDSVINFYYKLIENTSVQQNLYFQVAVLKLLFEDFQINGQVHSNDEYIEKISHILRENIDITSNNICSLNYFEEIDIQYINDWTTDEKELAVIIINHFLRAYGNLDSIDKQKIINEYNL